MRYHRLIGIAISLTFVFGTARRASADTGDQLLDRVKSEYPAALKAMEDVYSHARGSGSSKVTIPLKPSDERIIAAEFTFALDGDLQRLVRSFSDSSPARTGSRDQVFCINRKYSFALSRDEPGEPYLLNGYETNGSISIAEPIGESARNYFFAPFSVEKFLLSRLMAEPGFRFTKATSFLESGRDLVKIEFETTDKNPAIHSGSLIVSPSDGWALQTSEYYLHPSRKRPFNCTVEYAPSQTGTPFPRRVTIVEPSKLRREFEFKDVTFGASPESEFVLTLNQAWSETQIT